MAHGSVRGFSYDPCAPEVLDDPYPFYHRLLDQHPVYRNEERGFWTLSRFDDVQRAARDPSSFSNGHGVELDAAADVYPDTFGPGIVINHDPPDHTRLRKVVHSRFTPRSVAALENDVRRFVTELLDDLAEVDQPDLAADFAWRLPVTTISHVCGFPPSDRTYLQRVMFDFEARDAGYDLPESAINAAGELAEYIAQSLADRRLHPRDDLLSALIEAEKDGRLKPDEARGLTFILVMAGIDTTACLVSTALYRLADRPEDRHRLATRPETIPDAVEELVRWEAPVQGLARVAARDVTLHGNTIRAGEWVWLAFAAANRDPRRFDDPDRLDLTRAPKRHLGFGEGIHHCIGAPLGRLEARIAFEEFFRRFPNYTITGPNRRLRQHTTRGFVHLHARLA